MRIEMPKSLNDLLSILDREDIHDYRRYKAIRRYLSLAAWEKNIPISGSFELTPLCNFDCKMCYVHLTRDQMKGKELLSVEQWKDIMSQAVQNGMMYAELTGGECLSYPDFEKVYLHLVSLGVDVAVLTNGSLISEKTVELFNKYPPSIVQITLYGSSEDAYERVTGIRAFERVIQSVKMLKEAGIVVLLAITPSRYMLKDTKKLKDLLDDLGIPYEAGNMVFDAHEETGRHVFDFGITENEREELMKTFSPAKKGEFEAVEMYLEADSSAQGVPCEAGRNEFVIEWNGIMTQCHSLRLTKVDVLQVGFQNAWHQINDAAREYEYPSVCSSCECKQKCRRCPAEVEQMMKNLGDLSIICNRTKKRIV